MSQLKLRRTFEIVKEPEKVKTILSSLRKDDHLSKTFEGEAKNGFLTGMYTNLALINSLVIGYVKVKGNYNLTAGNLTIHVVPSKLFWFMYAFIFISMVVLKNSSEQHLIGTMLFAFMAIIIAFTYIFESQS